MTFGIWRREMEAIPHGYGIAWFDPTRHVGFCMRWPFNRVAGAFRAWYLEWQRPCPNDPIMAAYQAGRASALLEGSRRESEAYNQGYEFGIRHTLIALRATTEREASAALNALFDPLRP